MLMIPLADEKWNEKCTFRSVRKYQHSAPSSTAVRRSQDVCNFHKIQLNKLFHLGAGEFSSTARRSVRPSISRWIVKSSLLMNALLVWFRGLVWKMADCDELISCRSKMASCGRTEYHVLLDGPLGKQSSHLKLSICLPEPGDVVQRVSLSFKGLKEADERRY